MPNWCENDLTIYHDDPKVLAEIKALLSDEKGHMTFDKILPHPAALDDIHSGFCTIDGETHTIWRTNADHNDIAISPEERATLIVNHRADNLYDWHIAHWGTKWDACHSDDIGTDSHHLWVSFDTAWSPPTPVIYALAERYPDATIIHEYFECGVAFQGGLRFNGEGETYEWSGDYHGDRGG